jgi:hypothetical protein
MMAASSIIWNEPSTWPWVVYVWAAFAAIGAIKPAWRWIQRERGESWPPADGRIDSAEISKPNFSLTVKNGHYLADLHYSYSFAGMIHSGRFTRDIPTEYEAEEFIRDVQGKAIVVHYNPEKPSRSILLERDVEFLLKNRSPAPPPRLPSVSAVSPWIRPFLPVFIAISAVGFILSLWVHLGAVMGQRVAPEALFWILHIGIFVVWFPAVLIAQKLVGNMNRKDFWKVVLKNSPDWMRYIVYGFWGYAIVNFLFFMINAPTGSGGGNPPAAVWRGFSGHWMAFYSAAFAISYNADRNQAPFDQRDPRTLDRFRG